jgi:hypothetical protein
MSLEKEFKELLLLELEELSHTSHSSYLSARSSKYYIGKKSKDSNTVYMEKLENIIIQLREKIYGNTDYCIVQAVEELARINQDRHKFSKDQIISIAQKTLDLLRKIENDDYSTITQTLNKISIPDNYQINDIVVKAKRGCFFPMPIKEIICLLDELKISDENGNRLAIEFRNPSNKNIEDYPILQFFPYCKIIINSLPDCFEEDLSKKMFDMAIRRINKNMTHLTNKSGAHVSMIFRVSNYANKLVCLKREVRYKAAKYRGGDKFSHSYKPQGKTTEGPIQT